MGSALFAILFILIHGIVSLFRKDIYNISNNKFLLLIPLFSSIIAGFFYFSWWGLIEVDLSTYFNFSLLCLVLILIYIPIKKKYHLGEK
jgi:hypothetical protein